MDASTSIWLDCDPGLDDTLALIYAAHNPKINLLGVSTSPGNSSLSHTTTNALNILYNIGRPDLNVYAGSAHNLQGELSYAQIVHGENGLGGVQIKQSPKSAFQEQSFLDIYLKIMGGAGQVEWVNTGSLTNLCLLLMSFPQIKRKISRIVIMGGAITAGNRTPAAEFNIYCDPFAFQRVLKVKDAIPLVMIPLEVTHLFLANEQIYSHFKSYCHHPFGQALYNMLLHYQQFYKEARKWPFPPYHDPVTIYYLLHPEEFVLEKSVVEVDTGRVSKGRTNCFFNLSEQQQNQTTTFVATGIRGGVDGFWQEIRQAVQMIFSQEIQQKVQ